GALLTRHADVHQRARRFAFRGNVVGPLSELQAAVLLPQLDKLDVRNEQRAANVRRLLERLGAVPGIRPFTNAVEDSQPGYYKLGLQYDAEAFGLSRERFLQALAAEGVAVDAGFAALHVGRSPRRFRQVGSLDEAQRAQDGAVVLHHPVLFGPTAWVEEVAAAVEKVRDCRHELARCAAAKDGSDGE